MRQTLRLSENRTILASILPSVSRLGRRPTLPLILVLMVAIALMAIINLLIGSVKIPVADICRILVGDDSHEIWTNIIWKSRLPQVLTAIVAGAGLAVSGLQMQTVFRNPLAGPSVLGISNGSALGVAFVVLLSGKIGGVALSRLWVPWRLCCSFSGLHRRSRVM